MSTNDIYRPPKKIYQAPLFKLLPKSRSLDAEKQERLLIKAYDKDVGKEVKVFLVGDYDLLKRPCVAIVGSRKVSAKGKQLAHDVARGLALRDIVVVSGLAEGVDEIAHRTSIAAGGRTIAVIGTPLDEVYPRKNAELQEQIYRDHLLITKFPLGATITRFNFPTRNRLMAAISDASVIVDASETSGTTHQAAECRRLKRPLFIAKHILEDKSVIWPKKFLEKGNAELFETADELLLKLSL